MVSLVVSSLLQGHRESTRRLDIGEYEKFVISYNLNEEHGQVRPIISLQLQTNKWTVKSEVATNS